MFIDINWKCRTDGVFRGRLEALIRDIDRLENRQDASDGLVSERILDLYRLCDYNPGFLVPYFFPAYPKEAPMSLTDRPFSFSMMNFQIGGSLTVRGSRQIGKSSTFGAKHLINAHILPGYRSLYVVPHEEHRKTYANRLREMERAFRFPPQQVNLRQNLNYKEFPNKAVIELIKVSNTAKESRGKSADSVEYDECQHMDPSLEAEVEQVQTASNCPSTTYAGTSLTVETMLEAKWMESSQGTWHILSPDDTHWIDCGNREEVLKTIQPEGPTCPYSGRLLDVTRGQFVHADQAAEESGRIGIHIPKLIIPEFAADLIKWTKIYESFRAYETSKFLQEVMGIPTEEGARELTLEDVKRICCLPDSKAALREKARQGHYRFVLSGCDWGGSDYIPEHKTKVSYTLHCVLGLTYSGELDILHFRRYEGMGYREIIDQIVADHVDLHGHAFASDFGMGAAYNMLLREHPRTVADRHFIMEYVGPRAAVFGPPASGKGMFNQYSLNKTESITELFKAIKQTKPRIRCYAWEEAAPYLLDFLNVYRVLSEGNTGLTSVRYIRHGAKGDDALHALNFAYVLARVIIGEPIMEDRGLRDRLQQLLGVRAVAPQGGYRGARVVSG